MLKITYGLIDITAADDATSSCGDVQPFADIQAIHTPDLDRLVTNKNATLELNQWVLDGTFNEFPNEPKNEDWGLWSKQMSDENGIFAEPIVLTITFTMNHTSEGLTLFFRPDTYDYPIDFTLDYYSSAGDLLLSKNFSANSGEYFAESPVEDYQKIVLTFRQTSLPYRYLKLTELKYGSIKIFDEDSIIEATILEEVDPTGAELSFNTMECTIYTSDFQLLDPQGIYAMLQQKQAINVQSTDASGSKDFGTFFLEEPKSQDDDTTTLSCVDFLGVIDKTDFMGGVYENKNAGELFDEIMVSAEVEPDEYEVADELRAKTITGWLPICTHREAVQQWAFAVGAIVDCSRTKIIKAYVAPTEVSGTVTHDDKFMGHEVSLTPLVTGVQVTAHKYTISADTSSAFEGELPAGQSLVTFGQAYSGLSITGGTITQRGANYALVTMSSAGAVVISGKPYVDSTSVYAVNATELPANAKPNVVAVDESATLISAANALEISQRLYDYYQKRYVDEGEIILGSQQVGQMWRMNSLNNRDILGSFSRLEIDMLAETATVSITGVSAAREAKQ